HPIVRTANDGGSLLRRAGTLLLFLEHAIASGPRAHGSGIDRGREGIIPAARANDERAMTVKRIRRRPKETTPSRLGLRARDGRCLLASPLETAPDLPHSLPQPILVLHECHAQVSLP